MLLATSRAEKIERRVNKDTAQLNQELMESSGNDHRDSMKCPSCRAEMRKRRASQLDFFVDDCRQCGMSWFDGGELAALQLSFENDHQVVELNRMRERLKNMTDDERSEYEASIARLKDLGSPMEQAILSATFELTVYYYWLSMR